MPPRRPPIDAPVLELVQPKELLPLLVARALQALAQRLAHRGEAGRHEVLVERVAHAICEDLRGGAALAHEVGHLDEPQLVHLQAPHCHLGSRSSQVDSKVSFPHAAQLHPRRSEVCRAAEAARKAALDKAAQAAGAAADAAGNIDPNVPEAKDTALGQRLMKGEAARREGSQNFIKKLAEKPKKIDEK